MNNWQLRFYTLLAGLVIIIAGCDSETNNDPVESEHGHEHEHSEGTHEVVADGPVTFEQA